MIKKMLPYIKGYGKDIGLSVLCSTGESLLALLIPLVMAGIIDRGISNEDLPYTLKMGGLMAVMAIIVVAIGVLSAKYATRAGMGLGYQLRGAAYKHMQQFSFKEIESFGTGSLITRLTGDITAIQNAAIQAIKQLARCPSMMVISIILAFLIDWRLAFIFVALTPFVIVAVGYIMIKIRPMYRSMQESVDELNLVTQENLIGMRLVKAFVQRVRQSKLFENRNQRVYETSDRAMGFSVLTGPVSNTALYTATIVLFWLGGGYIMKGELSVGELTSMSTYMTQILTRILMIANVSIMLSRSFVSFRRILEILETAPSMDDNGTETEVAGGGIEFENVCFGYGSGQNVLKNLSFTIKPGETVGILGATGSGKTTLVQLIPRLYDVSSGRVLVGGRDVRDYSMKALRSAVSIVLQNNVLFSGSVRDNLLWGDPDADEADMESACKAACAYDFVSAMDGGLDHELGQGGGNVSGGQKQRLCIARAIVRRPKVLILDDSTSAVDTATDAKLRRAFREELEGVTKLIIAQRVDSVMDADRILVLDGGKIAALGNHRELMSTCPIYQELYQTQKGGSEIA